MVRGARSLAIIVTAREDAIFHVADIRLSATVITLLGLGSAKGCRKGNQSPICALVLV
jgi:hypothetical protein